MKSLQHRLHLGLGSSLIILMFLLWLLTHGTIRHLTQEFMLSRLIHDAENLAAAMSFNEVDTLLIDTKRIPSIYALPYSGHYFVIQTVNGTVLRSRSLWDENIDTSPLSVGKERYWLSSGPVKQQLLVWSSGFKKQGHIFTISVAEDITPIQNDVSIFSISFAVISISIFAILIVIQRLIVTRSLQPVNRLREDLIKLEQGDIDVLNRKVPSEIQPLVSEINHLLQLTENRLQRSRNALGNLAHALKHPLHLLTQISNQHTLQKETREELKQHTMQINKLIERELKRARLAGDTTPGRSFNPSEELPVLIDVVKRIYHDKTLDINYDIPPYKNLPVDNDDMLELIGNLLDNACKWARQTVNLTLHSDDTISLNIEDDGVGCSQEDIDKLSQRGVRIDESVSGHGLGLAIVRDIIELYGGELYIGRSNSLGGLSVTVVIPIAGRNSE